MLVLFIVLFTFSYIKCSLEHKAIEDNEQTEIDSLIEKHKKVDFNTENKCNHCRRHHSFPVIATQPTFRQSTLTNHSSSSSLTDQKDDRDTKESPSNWNYSYSEYRKSINSGDFTSKSNLNALSGGVSEGSNSVEEIICTQPVSNLSQLKIEKDVLEASKVLKQTDSNTEETDSSTEENEEILNEENQNKKDIPNSNNSKGNYTENISDNIRAQDESFFEWLSSCLPFLINQNDDRNENKGLDNSSVCDKLRCHLPKINCSNCHVTASDYSNCGFFYCELPNCECANCELPDSSNCPLLPFFNCFYFRSLIGDIPSCPLCSLPNNCDISGCGCGNCELPNCECGNLDCGNCDCGNLDCGNCDLGGCRNLDLGGCV